MIQIIMHNKVYILVVRIVKLIVIKNKLISITIKTHLNWWVILLIYFVEV